MAYTNKEIQRVITHVQKHPKVPGRTWYDIADELGMTYDQVRYIWNQYEDTPTLDTFENIGLGERVDETNYVPDGWEAVPSGTVFKDGTVGWKLRKKEESFEAIMRRAFIGLHGFKLDGTVERDKDIFIVWTDQHVGMSVEGTVFKAEWNPENLKSRINEVFAHIPEDVNVYIIFGGDLIDGEDGYTASRTHKLTQNLNDAEMFYEALVASRQMIEGAATKSKGKVFVKMVVNCNHNKFADEKVGLALQDRYSDNSNIDIELFREFIGHFSTKANHIILTHGKDNHTRKRGLSLPLKPLDIKLIEEYIEEYGLTDMPVVLVRADLHQSEHRPYDKFTDIMAPSFALGSGYIANNYASRNPGGFCVFDFINQVPRAYFPRFKN